MIVFDVCCVCVCTQSITAPYEQVYPAEEYDNKDVDDNCKYTQYLARLCVNARIFKTHPPDTCSPILSFDLGTESQP